MTHGEGPDRGGGGGGDAWCSLCCEETFLRREKEEGENVKPTTKKESPTTTTEHCGFALCLPSLQHVDSVLFCRLFLGSSLAFLLIPVHVFRSFTSTNAAGFFFL